jgi:DNA-binding MarR family transcriptional regulator
MNPGQNNDLEKNNSNEIAEKRLKKSESLQERAIFDVDTFLHDKIRLQIMRLLMAVDKTDMIFIKNTLQITWGNLSSHCTKLEEKGYVEITKEFIAKKPHTILKITPDGIRKFEEYKNAMQNFLKI